MEHHEPGNDMSPDRGEFCPFAHARENISNEDYPAEIPKTRQNANLRPSRRFFTLALRACVYIIYKRGWFLNLRVC